MVRHGSGCIINRFPGASLGGGGVREREGVEEREKL